jgi:hypothetical protein
MLRFRAAVGMSAPLMGALKAKVLPSRDLVAGRVRTQGQLWGGHFAHGSDLRQLAGVSHRQALVIVDALADAFAARHQLAANDDPAFGK